MNASLLLDHVESVWVETVVRVTFLLVVGLCLCLALRRSAAAIRHFVWSLAIMGTLLAPLLAVIAPRWEVSIWRIKSSSPATTRVVSAAPAVDINPATDADARPGVGQSVSLHPNVDRRGGVHVFAYGYKAETDKQGRFVFPRVVPVDGWAARDIVTPHANGGWTNSYTHRTAVRITPGMTTRITIGETGRPVVRNIATPKVNEKPFDWSENESVYVRTLERGPAGVTPPFRGGVSNEGNAQVFRRSPDSSVAHPFSASSSSILLAMIFCPPASFQFNSPNHQ